MEKDERIETTEAPETADEAAKATAPAADEAAAEAPAADEAAADSPAADEAAAKTPASDESVRDAEPAGDSPAADEDGAAAETTEPAEKPSRIRRFFASDVLKLVVGAIVIDFIVEALSRHSVVESGLFLVEHPLVSACNVMIILAVISLSLLFRKRVFAMCMFSLIWIALGITNCVILANRMTPFNVKDMSNLKEGTQILRNYFSVTNLVIIGLGIAAFALAVILLYRKTPKRKEKVKYSRAIPAVILIIALAFGSVQAGMKTGVLDTFFGNLAYAYRDNGMPYSFMITWVKTGIDKPANYSAEEIRSIFSKGELGDDGIYTPVEDDTTDVEKKPNIIYLQMESFIDPAMVKGFSYSEDPVPNFHELMRKYSSGYITVPAVGAGTANVEFEAITGISARFFGPGEYPHKSVLTEETCESAAYDMKNIGYSSHAIHNHRGAFYNRNTVFRNLGFDTFTCLEYMNNVTKTPKNWAKDAVLTESIFDALESTKGPDYIYTISVQGHGKYPTEQVLEDPKIQVTESPDEEQKWAYEYFANQMYEMDQFLKELTDRLKDYDEDTIVVIYGDHLPALNMTADMMESGDLYKTQYVIWNNFGMPKVDKEMTTYRIHAEVLKRLGISAGMLTRYHQDYYNEKTYMRNFRALAYDMLYGQRYIYGGKNIYKPSDMRMGVKEIKIDKIVQIGDNYYIKGQNFTEFSRISLNGEILDTVYLGPTILALNEDVDPEEAVNMKVSQVEKNKEVLSTTE